MNVNPSLPDLTVFGAGGHGRVIADSALRAGFKRIVFVDNNPVSNTGIQGIIILNSIDVSKEDWRDRPFIVGIGKNEVRARIYNHLSSLGARPVSVIDPGSQVSRFASISTGCFIAPGAIVNTNVTIDCNVIINTAATVDHDCVLYAHCQVAPGAHLGGGVRLGVEAMVCIGATIVPSCSIGEKTIIGAGSVVTRNISSRITAWGIPAKITKSK